ncbi:MAG: hypothetical protein M1818_008077 [Claussenomyces sp. TS43310]|nr:MAG: hypothetical protein M1818_008077 [Claussenomyces sp. TS43310]
MSGVLRHTACRLCRDRKVRCNGEQPACETCRRAGEECVYLPTCRPNKVDLVQTVETLQERLDKAEDLIRRMDNQTNRVPPYIIPGKMSPDFTALTPSSLQMPPIPSSGDAGFASDHTNFSSWLYQNPSGAQSHEQPGNDFLCLPRPTEAMTSRNDGGQFWVEEVDASSNPHPLTAPTANFPMPSLREIRELNSSSSYPPPSTQNGRVGRESEESSTIATELAAFTVTVFTAQSDIAGISLVLAEYLEWMRKAPRTYDHGSMLEKLESRAREVHDIAKTRHYVAWKNMVAALEPLRLGSRLRELEGEVCRRLAEMEQFFHGDYDVKSALCDQRKSQAAQTGRFTSTTPSGAAET